ncbi:hypothetical protein PoMZ_06600 [Pyricularia oryzae]|uniref:Uncharacterized protein n=1 Tax=Pyricularia oryzae TaxID=318829 RepID=A0A4P7NRH3_PYROR|nr:hypothetical protein PoMZ_06600 [Pyricularia oryzae]
MVEETNVGMIKKEEKKKRGLECTEYQEVLLRRRHSLTLAADYRKQVGMAVHKFPQASKASRFLKTLTLAKKDSAKKQPINGLYSKLIRFKTNQEAV